MQQQRYRAVLTMSIVAVPRTCVVNTDGLVRSSADRRYVAERCS